IASPLKCRLNVKVTVSSSSSYVTDFVGCLWPFSMISDLNIARSAAFKTILSTGESICDSKVAGILFDSFLAAKISSILTDKKG
ncbi:hypothetical protein Bhyg_16340, partial [Pseudolycoriella hygida]